MTDDKTTKTTHRYRCRGNWVKKESIAKDDPDFGYVILSRELSYLQICPRIKHAWISFGRVDSDSSESIDPRCAGFPPEFSDLGTWLKDCEEHSIALVSDLSGKRVVRLAGATASSKRGAADFLVDFDPAQSYLPVTVVFMFPNTNTVSSITKLAYQPVKSDLALFLKRKHVRSYLNGTPKDPEKTGPTHTVETVVLGEPQTDLKFAPGEFDPIIPPNTRIVGNLAADAFSPDEPVPASRLTLKNPVVLRQIK